MLPGYALGGVLSANVVTDYDRARVSGPRLQAIIDHWDEIDRVPRAGMALMALQTAGKDVGER